MLALTTGLIPATAGKAGTMSADAECLIGLHGPDAYYEAQRRAARSRARVDGDFLHWAKVAAEIARRDPSVSMDIDVLKALAARELEIAPSAAAKRQTDRRQ